MDFTFNGDNNYIRRFERIIQTQNDNSNSSSCAATSLSEGNAGSSTSGNTATIHASSSNLAAVTNALNRNGTLASLSGNALNGNSLTGSLLDSVSQTLVVVGGVASNGLSNLSTSGKKRRPQLSPQQRELINSKRRVSSLTPEQRESRNAKRRVTYLSPEQRERINSKRRVSSLSAEQREIRNAKRRIAALTPAQREMRNQKRRNATHTGTSRKRQNNNNNNNNNNSTSTNTNTRGRNQNNIVNSSLANLTQQVGSLATGASSLIGVNVVTPGQLTNGGNGSDLTLADMINIHHQQQQQQQHLHHQHPTIHVTADPSSGLSNLASTLSVAASSGGRHGAQSIITLSEPGQQLHMIDSASGTKYITIKNDQLSNNGIPNSSTNSSAASLQAQNIPAAGLIFTSGEQNLSYIRGDLFGHKLPPYTSHEVNAIRNNSLLSNIRKC